MSDKAFATSDFEMVYVRLMQLVTQCRIEKFNVVVNNLFKVDLLRHWQKYSRRYSSFTRALLSSIDKAMVAIHSVMFR